MQMNKKISALLLSLSFAATALPAYASEAPAIPPENTELPALSMEASGIVPFWVAVSQISHGVTFSGSTANVYSNCYAWYNNYKVYSTVTLEKVSQNGMDAVKSWSGSGTGSAHVSQSCTVSSGTYRVKTSATIYDNSGKYVESVTEYSTLRVY